MKCPACHENMVEKKRGEIELRIDGRLYLVRNISFEECPVCGERVLSPNVGQQIYEKLKAREYKEETIQVPVLDGTYG